MVVDSHSVHSVEGKQGYAIDNNKNRGKLTFNLMMEPADVSCCNVCVWVPTKSMNDNCGSTMNNDHGGAAGGRPFLCWLMSDEHSGYIPFYQYVFSLVPRWCHIHSCLDVSDHKTSRFIIM